MITGSIEVSNASHEGGSGGWAVLTARGRLGDCQWSRRPDQRVKDGRSEPLPATEEGDIALRPVVGIRGGIRAPRNELATM